jgi:hypothetical protein
VVPEQNPASRALDCEAAQCGGLVIRRRLSGEDDGFGATCDSPGAKAEPSLFLGEPTFIGKRGNGKDAPKADIPGEACTLELIMRIALP